MTHSRDFLGADFLLDTPAAVSLYHDHAARLPIIDYHCHLSPAAIADDAPFASITELWLGGDHYKWRAMRANGIDERYITGDASDREKFAAWAATVPYTLRNPLYHWTHLELRTAFGITDLLGSDTADSIYDRCNELLKSPDMTPRGLMRRYRVETVCTTDDPADSLEHHRRIAESGFEVRVLPTWRPDRAIAVDAPDYRDYLATLGRAADIDIASYADLLEALGRRHDYFHACGCRLADHGLGEIPWAPCTEAEATRIFGRLLAGHTPAPDEAERLRTALLLELMRLNARSGWAQQIHFGPLRNVNTRARRTLGPDTGFDTIGDFRAADRLARLLDTLDTDGLLARTILYNLNPADNVWVAAMIGNFQDGAAGPGKIQMGSGWWFNDQIQGMRDQMNALSTQGLLSRFVGMLTDSRSFLSYPRHEYFRRVLCGLVGDDIDRGLIPAAMTDRAADMVEDICYYNAKRYFNF